MENLMEDLRLKYEVVIGLEVHAQLKTKSKIFCADGTEFGLEQNEQTSPVSLGLPGVLPVLNKEVLNMAILTGLALNCTIAPYTKFDRKQYFYADLPKGYQISQFDKPIATNGFIEIKGKKIRINRVHMEEDAGKLVHAGADGIAGSAYSLVDLNRAGVPLLEIVSEADMRSAEEARAYMEELRNIVRYLGVCDGNLEEGSLRCDANISIRPVGQKEFGTKAEIKNMNSFKALQRAIEFEVDRQIDVVESGGHVVQETRLWNEAEGVTKSMRSKEEAHDYRYFPEPDVMPVTVTKEMIEEVAKKMPELPQQKRKRYEEQLGLSEYDATVIVEQMDTARFFDKVVEKGVNVKIAVNYLMGDVTAYLKETKLALDETKLTPDNLAELVSMIDKGTISNNIGKKVLETLLKEGGSAQAVVDAKGLSVISDEDSIKAIAKKVVDENPEQVAAYKGGRDKLFGFFVGQVMKETKGRANPQVVNKLLHDLLDN